MKSIILSSIFYWDKNLQRARILDAGENMEEIRIFLSRIYDLQIAISEVLFRWWLGETWKKSECVKQGIESMTFRLQIRVCFSDVDSTKLGRAILFV